VIGGVSGFLQNTMNSLDASLNTSDLTSVMDIDS